MQCKRGIRIDIELHEIGDQSIDQRGWAGEEDRDGRAERGQRGEEEREK